MAAVTTPGEATTVSERLLKNIDATLADGIAPSSAIAIAPTVTCSATPDYTSGDVLGTELTLTNAARGSGGYTKLKDIVITDDAAQATTGNILIFNSDPAGTFTDNAACPDLTTDIAKIVGRITLSAADWVTVGTVGIAHIAVDRVYKASGSANLFAVIVVTTANNQAATTDIGITFNFERF